MLHRGKLQIKLELNSGVRILRTWRTGSEVGQIGWPTLVLKKELHLGVVLFFVEKIK